MKKNETHESFTREEDVERPADRQFGIVMAVAFGVISAAPLLRGRPIRVWALIVAAAFLAAAFAAPRILRPLNRLWLWIGSMLHRCTTPIVLGVVFFSTVTPIGVLLRVFGKDPLRLKSDPNAPTYWIERRPPGPAGHTMPQQF